MVSEKTRYCVMVFQDITLSPYREITKGGRKRRIFPQTFPHKRWQELAFGKASRGFGYPPKNPACYPNHMIGAAAPNPTKNYEMRYQTIEDKNTVTTESRRERNKKISFWASETERRKIKKIIAKSGLSQREYLLGAALGRTIYQVNELKPVLSELKAIGRNLNQLTVLSHQGRITSANLTEAVSTLQKVYAAINVLYDICDGVIASGSEGNNDGNL